MTETDIPNSSNFVFQGVTYNLGKWNTKAHEENHVQQFRDAWTWFSKDAEKLDGAKFRTCEAAECYSEALRRARNVSKLKALFEAYKSGYLDYRVKNKNIEKELRSKMENTAKEYNDEMPKLNNKKEECRKLAGVKDREESKEGGVIGISILCGLFVCAL